MHSSLLWMTTMDDWLLTIGSKDTPGQPARVRDCQYLLSGHNVFGHTWYPGRLDGYFGPVTGSAAKRAKWELGYPDDAVVTTYGPLLRAFLLGDKPLPLPYKLRRRQRQPKF